ncbi:AAA family ATPase [Streptomyces sp. NPDC020792]|uniref:dihydrofolate reductase family protein n=1 Tax=Streptomyces sp. NPDC020792 TaxID=3365089 RepID=UPI0037944EAF
MITCAGVFTGAFGTVGLVLAGRDPERAAIAALLDAARTGSGGALVVRGVAGVGKSALLGDVLATALDLRVLRTSGVESESPLAFAALQRLLWPLRTRIDALPAPQAAALRAAMGETEGEGDRFRAFLGTLSLLADAADEAPLLVVVDDAHWLDDASAAALLFAARRLQAERVALLFAARDGDARQFDAGDLPTIVLGGVTGADTHALLSEHTRTDIDPAARDQLVAGTGGNPLALVELAGVLTADQLTRRAPLPTPLPLTGGVGDPLALVRELKQQEGTGLDVWLCGGGKLAGALLPEIDELVVKNYPVVAGAGIPAFDGAFNPAVFHVAERTAFPSGVTLTHLTRRY